MPAGQLRRYPFEAAIATPIISLLFLLLVLIYAFYCADKIIRYQYEHHPEIWKADGEPSGLLFWRAPDLVLRIPQSVDAARRYRFGQAQVMKLLSTTPQWIVHSPEMRRVHRNLRIAAVVWNAGAVVWGIVYLYRW